MSSSNSCNVSTTDGTVVYVKNNNGEQRLKPLSYFRRTEPKGLVLMFASFFLADTFAIIIMAVESFNIEKVLELFQASLKDEDDILLDEYLLGFEEINRFFHLMGTVFGFVSSDVRSKIDILADFRKNENSHKFISFKTMIEYEQSSGLLNNTGYVSGSRTLLRLHRGLEFVHEFLLKLGELGECDKSASCCKHAYNDTLAKHHPWLIRNGALVAMYAMPTKGELLKRVGVSATRATEILPEMLKATKVVHNRTENLYTVFDLHSLP